MNRKNFKPPDKEVLEELYINRQMKMKDIADELGIAVGTVYNFIHKYGIEPRRTGDMLLGRKISDETKEKIRKMKTGRIVSEGTRRKMSESLKQGGIGKKKNRSDGYVAVYFPDHPKSNKEGYIMEHILVMECLLGRHLKEDEVVHHKNGVRCDNRKENLQLMTFKEHSAYHIKERHKNHSIKYHKCAVKNLTTGEVYESAREAARIYRVRATNITRACREPQRKVKGCSWEYYKEEKTDE